MQSRMYKLLSTTYILHLEGASELEFIDYIDDENVKCACGQKLHIANVFGSLANILFNFLCVQIKVSMNYAWLNSGGPPSDWACAWSQFV